MAERTHIATRRGGTLTITDASGTPKTYSIKFGDGTLNFTNGGHNIVRGRDNSGDFQGVPRQGEQAGPSTIGLQGLRMYGTGGNSTDVAMIDFLASAIPVSGWTSDGVTTERLVFDLALSIPNVSIGGTTYKGASFAWANCVFAPGSSFTAGADGYTLDATIESSSPYVTITENA